jgi:hypothetical protein
MAEKTLEKPVCQNCSADIRPGALFCYHCGSQVAALESENSNNNGNIKLRLREEKVDKYSTGKLGFDEAPIEKPSDNPFALPVGKSSETQEKVLQNEGQTPVKTAASLRKKNRAAKKKVEIVWQPAEDSPNILFIAVSLILLLVAIVILMTMLYIR